MESHNSTRRFDRRGARPVLGLIATVGLSFALQPGRAGAQEAAPGTMPAPATSPPLATPASPAARMVGGHVGVAVPVVRFNTVGKGTVTPGDQLTIAVPIGISVHVSPDWVIDFETVVASDVDPWGATGLTVDPGVVYVGAPVALGLRAKFDIGGPANVGLIPLVHKGIVDVGGANWFIEAAFPMTATRTAGYSLGIVAHTGFAF
jgi:hypothetical protein